MCVCVCVCVCVWVGLFTLTSVFVGGCVCCCMCLCICACMFACLLVGGWAGLCDPRPSPFSLHLTSRSLLSISLRVACVGVCERGEGNMQVHTKRLCASQCGLECVGGREGLGGCPWYLCVCLCMHAHYLFVFLYTCLCLEMCRLV